MTGRLDKLFKVTVRLGDKQHISFRKDQASTDKYIKGVRRIEKQTNVSNVKIFVRKPIK